MAENLDVAPVKSAYRSIANWRAHYLALLVLLIAVPGVGAQIGDSLHVEIFPRLSELRMTGEEFGLAGDTLLYHATLYSDDGVRTSGVLHWRIEPPSGGEMWAVDDTTVAVAARSSFDLHVTGSTITAIRLGVLQGDSVVVFTGLSTQELEAGTYPICAYMLDAEGRVQLYGSRPTSAFELCRTLSPMPYRAVAPNEKTTFDGTAAAEQSTNAASFYQALLAAPRVTLTLLRASTPTSGGHP